MRITAEFLEKLNACEDCIRAFRKTFGESADLADVVERGIADGGDNLDYVAWLLPRCMGKTDCVRYAVFSARLVLDNAGDQREVNEKAILAAEAWLAKPCAETQAAAWSAWSAESAVWSPAAWSAAAWSAAAWSAAEAAEAAWSAAARSAWSAAERSAAMEKILRYGLALLNG